jgi:hypothetical protein
VIKQKSRDLFARNQRSARKIKDGGLIPTKPRSSLAKPSREGVRGILSRQIHDQRPRLDQWASARAHVSERG